MPRITATVRPSFDGSERLPSVLVAGSEYRIRSLEKLQDSLTSTGFEIEHLYGGWDRRPLAAAGADLVFVAKRL